MNKPNVNKKPLRGLASVCAIAALAGALLATTAGVASAGYGPGALYQIELVAGDNGASLQLPPGQGGIKGPQGGGIWLWIALYPDFTADYSGTDCIDGGGTFGLHGAYPDAGDATWHYSGGSIVIPGILLKGLSVALGTPFYTTITVPAVYGHYTGTLGTFMTFSVPGILDPDGGLSLVQVAGGAPGTTP